MLTLNSLVALPGPKKIVEVSNYRGAAECSSSPRLFTPPAIHSAHPESSDFPWRSSRIYGANCLAAEESWFQPRTQIDSLRELWNMDTGRPSHHLKLRPFNLLFTGVFGKDFNGEGTKTRWVGRVSFR